MDIHINSKTIDYILVSDTLEGVFIDGIVKKYYKLEGFTLKRPKPSFIEKLFGKRESYDRVFPEAFYLDKEYYNEYILESNIDSNHFIEDNKIFSKPFISIFQNNKCLGTRHFESLEEAKTYVKKRFGSLGLKVFTWDLQ